MQDVFFLAYRLGQEAGIISHVSDRGIFGYLSAKEVTMQQAKCARAVAPQTSPGLGNLMVDHAFLGYRSESEEWRSTGRDTIVSYRDFPE